MGWDRKGHGRYYYFARRIDGRVCKQYVGGGSAGRLAADLDRLGRLRRRAGRAAWSAREAQIAAAAGPLEVARPVADLVIHAALLVGGFHRHKGQWRRRRV